jgi:hypothetical protein
MRERTPLSLIQPLDAVLLVIKTSIQGLGRGWVVCVLTFVTY